MATRQIYNLQDLCKKITKGTTPNAKVGGFATAGINFIKSESLSYDGLVDPSKFAFISSNTHEKLKRSIIEENDILYSIAGMNLGKCASIERNNLPANTNQAVAIIRVDEQRAHSKYIEFFLRNRSFVRNILAGVAQSAQPNVNLAEIGKFQIMLPSLSEQKAIASVLGALDDKIKNNRQMNETLEEMARAIFKSWFVDFDPVHAKAAGNAPAHMDAETATLFPSSFGDDGLPVGWINKTLGDFIEIQNGYAFKSKDWTDEGIPVVKIGSVKPSIVDLSNCSFVSAEVAEQKRNFQLKVGDILIGLTGYVGEVGRVPPADKMPMLNQRVGRVVFKRESFEPFVYAAMRLPEFKSFAESQSHGSAQANVSTKQLQEYPVVVADNLLIQKFNEVLESYFEKILTNSAENQTLAELRDNLLPKLMSGEIRVKDAEREVEAAV